MDFLGLKKEGSMKRLVVADDHSVVREALCSMLEGRGDYQVVGQASDGEELLGVLEGQCPDLLILDVQMPKLNGLEALERLKADGSALPVLVLSADETPDNIRAVFKAGAKGFMPKNAKLDELLFAISSVLDGRTYISPTNTQSLLEGSSQSTPDLSKHLTKREIEILAYLADGKPNREIGKTLHISTRTVDTHRSNILKKLKLRTNAELVKVALNNGLIKL